MRHRNLNLTLDQIDRLTRPSTNGVYLQVGTNSWFIVGPYTDARKIPKDVELIGLVECDLMKLRSGAIAVGKRYTFHPPLSAKPPSSILGEDVPRDIDPLAVVRQALLTIWPEGEKCGHDAARMAFVMLRRGCLTSDPTMSGRVRIKAGWEGAGREGTLLAVVYVDQYWSGVKWDDEEDPDWHKTSALEAVS